MQATQIVNAKKQRRRQTAVLLVIGVVLIIVGLVALFSLSGKSVRFDNAYDAGGDLSPYFFEKLEEGQSYTAMQSLWLGIVRNRTLPMLAGIAAMLCLFCLAAPALRFFRFQSQAFRFFQRLTQIFGAFRLPEQ